MGKDWSYLRHTVTQNPALASHLPSTRGNPYPFIVQLGDRHHGKVEERETKQREEER